MDLQSKNNKENEKSEALFSLHKYWIRADLMCCNWRKAEKPLLISLYIKIFAPLKEEAPLFYNFYQQRHDDSIQNTYFVYWLAGIFCVMEGYKKLSLNYNEIDSSLNDLSKCLKNYRDCTYHFEIDVAMKIRAQKKVHEKLSEVIELHNTIGGCLLKEINNLIASKQGEKRQYKDLHLPSSTISPMELKINNKPSSFYDFFNFMSYWEQANIFRHHFNIELATNIDKDDIHLNAYMDYWYGALYSLIEGYLKLGYIHNGVDLLLASDPSLLTSLKSYRHATFHYAKIYHNFSLKGSLLKEQKSVKWLNKLHEAFNDYVIKELLKPDIQCFIIKYLGNIKNLAC